MKEFYKQANFYFVLVPAIATLWAVLTWTVSIPTAEKKWVRSQEHFKDAQIQVERILALDPERIDFEKQKGESAQFDYATAVEKFASAWQIPATNYSFKTQKEVTRSGRKTKGATVSIKPVDIETFTQFISAMMYRWPDLQCDSLKLTKQKDGPDAWKVDMKFTYYY